MRLFLLVLLLCLGIATAAVADPFGRPANADPTPAQDSGNGGPSVMGGLVQRLARTQNRLNGWVSHEIRTVRDTGSPMSLLTVLAVAFLWGILHAAGPGHGKSLVAAYLVSTEARWTSGIVLGGAISLLQGLTAIVAVLLLAALLHELQAQVRLQGAVIELFSYGLVALLGLVMLWRAATGQGHAHHHHGPLGAAPGHEHGHHEASHHEQGIAAGTTITRARIFTAAAGRPSCGLPWISAGC